MQNCESSEAAEQFVGASYVVERKPPIYKIIQIIQEAEKWKLYY